MIQKGMSEEERLEYCRSVIEAQKSSGLPVKRWCEENGIAKARFYRYRRYVLGTEEALAEGTAYETSADSGMPDKGTSLVINAGRGVKICLESGCDWDAALAVLRKLVGAC